MSDIINAPDIYPLSLTIAGMFFTLFFIRAGIRAIRKPPPNVFGITVAGYIVSVFFISLGGWMAQDSLKDPMGTSTARMTEGAHEWTLGALGISMATWGAGTFFALLVITVHSARKKLTASNKETDEPIEPRLSEADKQMLLSRIDSDELWAHGPSSVAAHLFECWRRIGVPDDWETDGKLWERVDNQLKQRYLGYDAQVEIYDKIREEYLKLLETKVW